jgi:hypothetical protein
VYWTALKTREADKDVIYVSSLEEALQHLAKQQEEGEKEP